MLDRDLIQVLLDRKTLRGGRRLRLVAAWPHVGAVAGRETRLKRWAMLAGVPMTEARTLTPQLLELGICKDGGGIDDTAAAVVDTALVDAIEGAAGPRTKPRRGAQE